MGISIFHYRLGSAEESSARFCESVSDWLRSDDPGESTGKVLLRRVLGKVATSPTNERGRSPTNIRFAGQESEVIHRISRPTPPNGCGSSTWTRLSIGRSLPWRLAIV